MGGQNSIVYSYFLFSKYYFAKVFVTISKNAAILILTILSTAGVSTCILTLNEESEYDLFDKSLSSSAFLVYFLLHRKFEEIYPPEVSDFVYITDDTYTTKQVRVDIIRSTLQLLSIQYRGPLMKK